MGIYTARTTKRGKKPRFKNSKSYWHEISSNIENDKQKIEIYDEFSNFMMVKNDMAVNVTTFYAFQEKNKDVDNAVNYLKTIFWHYANNEQRYNYSQVN